MEQRWFLCTKVKKRNQVMELLTALTCSFPRQLALHHVVTLGPHCSASAPWPCTEPSGGLITAAGPQRTEG